MARKKKAHLTNISEFKSNLEFVKETYGNVSSFTIKNTRTEKKKEDNKVSISEIDSITKVENDFFMTFLNLFIESFNIKDIDDFNERVCNFFNLEEFQKCLNNDDFLKAEFYCNEECTCIDGLCENLLNCQNYEAETRLPFLEINSSQNMTKISVTKLNSKHIYSLTNLEYDSLSLLAYFKYFLNDLEILVKDKGGKKCLDTPMFF